MFAVSAHAERKWVGRRSNPRLLVFSQALNRLSYRPRFRVVVSPPPALAPRQQKRPDVVVTPGLCLFVALSRPSVTSAAWARAYSPPANRFPAHLDRHLDARSSFAARNNPRLCVLGTNSAVRMTSKLSPQSCWQSHGGPCLPKLYFLDAGRVSRVREKVEKSRVRLAASSVLLAARRSTPARRVALCRRYLAAFFALARSRVRMFLRFRLRRFRLFSDAR